MAKSARPQHDAGRRVLHKADRRRRCRCYQGQFRHQKLTSARISLRRPACTSFLAALGADVIKIESPTRPDGFRFSTAKPADLSWWEHSAMFLVLNGNKRSVTLDLNEPTAVEILRQLVTTADVLIENFAPRVMDNFDITWDRIHSWSQSTVFIRMPGFGLSSPWRDRTAFGPTIEQLSGMASLTGYGPSQPTEPRGMADPIAGAHTAFAVLIGLEDRRASTGSARQVVVPMVESALNVASEVVLEYSANHNVLFPNGNMSRLSAPQGVYPCRDPDTWIAISVVCDRHWGGLVDALGRPKWMDTSRFEHFDVRSEESDLIDRQLAAETSRWEGDSFVTHLLTYGIPAAPVHAAAEVLQNEQLLARGFYTWAEHPVAGPHPFPTLPFASFVSDVEWLRSAAPTLGQHNDEVLRQELGIEQSNIESLESEGVIGKLVPFQLSENPGGFCEMIVSNNTPLLSAKHVSVRFGGLLALSEVSITVPHSAIVGLVGPNGAGKSTLFSVLSGLQETASGTIEFAGQNITRESPEARARLGMARTFQHPEVYSSLTVRDHLRLSDRIRRAPRRQWLDLFSGKGFSKPDAAENERVDTILEMLGITSLSGRLAQGLPLGTNRLIEVGRAMALDPRLILLDEPCSGLDAGERDQLATALNRISSERGISLLMVEHDFDIVSRLAETVVVLNFGVRIATGSPMTIRNDPVVQGAYLGDVSAQNAAVQEGI
jgi:crotonobetainyl-CoA:carnitine CoA-transferase CaiB-like acyl-CoA transferase/ABC-type branched-subunit amino acid transport system ATPase component